MTRKRLALKKTSAGTRKRGSVSEKAASATDVGPDADAAPGVQAQPLILIELDSSICGGHMHDRFDIMIRGRTVSAASITEVRLQVGEQVISVACYGGLEPEAAVVMPDGSAACQRVFHFNLPRPGDGRAARCAFRVIGRTAEGFEHAEDFELEIDPVAGNLVAICSGPTRVALTSASVLPSAVMYIERGTIDEDGLLSTHGWAASLEPIRTIQVFADEAHIAEARLGGERPDVALAFPAYPNAALSGFSLTVPLGPAHRDARRILVQVVCANGFAHQESIPVEQPGREGFVGKQPATAVSGPRDFSLLNQLPSYRLSTGFSMPDNHPLNLVLPPARSGIGWSAPASADIHIFCDTAELTHDGMLSLDGWAVCGVGLVQARLLLDNEEVGLATLGHPRPDVGDIFPDIAMARFAGFRFEQRVGERFTGEHDIRIVVRNLRDAEDAKELSVTVIESVVPEEPPAEQELTPEQAAEFRFELDAPVLSNDVAVALVTGRLTIDGWLLTRSGVASFEVFLDGQLLGEAHHGLARQDVGAAFADWPNSLRSGYAFHCPPRSLRDGQHTVELRIRSNNGHEIIRPFRITVKKAEDQQDITGIRRRVPRVEIDMMAAFLAEIDYWPTCQFLLRQRGVVDINLVRQTLGAVRLQAYPHWTVCILAEDASVVGALRPVIDHSMGDLAGRCTIISPSDAAWTEPLGRSADGTPTLSGLLLPGDEPGADALLEVAVASGRHRERGLLYADEVRISPVSAEREPFFKPDFSPDLLLSTNYIGRPWFATAELLAETGVTPASLAADGEYDLVLRCAEAAASVHHIPKLLCQRAAAELDCASLEQAALMRSLTRRGVAGDVLATPVPGTWRVKRPVPSQAKVSIIIPTCAAKGYIETCITSLRTRTAFRDYEIICVDNIPRSSMAWKVWLQQHADKVLEIPDAFNWSSFNNQASRLAEGEFLLFLNDDVEIIQDDWLDAMMEHAQRQEVGITGPQLLYPDGKVQHAGMFLSDNGIGRHAFRFAANDDPCYFGLALTQRNVMAVTGACMLVRRETFDRLGGFDEAHEVVNNDLDFCLRAHSVGLLTVFTPYATLIHYELASRASMKDVFNLTHFNAAWKTTFAAGDPYFNPRLSRHADDYRPDDEPVQLVVAGSPMFNASEIQRILVLKLDHMGDFVTALPPIRRLKKLFPYARITVLAGPASGAFISLEPCIDEFIPFAFFHARSQLGERTLGEADYAELAAQLLPRRFDLAVDLRKHLSTRDVLKHTGARFLAGFDYLGQFPFLDIALDWDGDRALQRKRSHVVDDLMGLVNAIGHASDTDRVVMLPSPAAMPLTQMPEQIQGLFSKQVVVVHPGAGNVTKQWPVEHFSALIDLLIEKNDVNVLLIGGPDEEEIANELLQSTLYAGAVVSVVGETALAELPGLLKNCALYIGNDSGPKHIAAAVGIPTIGIHSGVVDPVEWGPIGPNAVALRRNMTCSPCYLARAEDCPRSLACLRLLEPSLVYETADLLLRRVSPPDPASPDLAAPAVVTKPKVRPRRRQRATEPA